MKKYTKIVATLGPASSTAHVLESMISSGVNVARLNFSHGDYKFHEENIKLFRKSAKKVGERVAILQDLSGPKIRIGDFKDGSIVLEKGQTFTLTTEKILGDKNSAYINYEKLPNEVKAGDSVMVFDGKIDLKVKSVSGNKIKCTVLEGGEISNRKGVNIPGANLSIKTITEKDKKDVAFGVKNNVEFIALSFVRSADDIKELRGILKKAKSRAMIIAKIETQEAVKNFDEILEEVDAVMVARGDLAVEIGAENVPKIQKEIITKCNRLGKPVITATQMLDSMEHSPVPTRAEVSDVANAILDGSDAVMLSGETATGRFPVETIETISRIAEATELSRTKRQFVHLEDSEDVIDAVTLSVVRVAETVKAKALIALTESGLTARMIGRFRAPYPIFAISPNEIACNHLSLSYGVFPVKMICSKNVDVFTNQIRKFALENKIAKKGEKIVLSAGMPFGKVGSTNTLFVLNI